MVIKEGRISDFGDLLISFCSEIGNSRYSLNETISYLQDSLSKS